MKTVSDQKNVAQKAGKALDKLFKERNGKPLLFLLSGGSSLSLLTYINENSLDSDVTVGMLDDRYDTDPTINSYLILQSSDFYTKALRADATILDSSVHKNETLPQYAHRYEGYIKDWIDEHPGGIIRATVGIGPDGHTSGILPFPEDAGFFNDLFNGERLIVGYDVKDKNPHRYRMTATFTLMRKFDAVLTYMTGLNKLDALKKVKAAEGSLAETPGRIVRELNNATIYTDLKL